MSASQTVRERREEILQLLAGYGAHDVRIFGSQARGMARPDSDLDILIKPDPGRSLLDIVAIKSTIHWQDATIRQLEVIGEATKRLWEITQDSLPARKEHVQSILGGLDDEQDLSGFPPC